MSRHRTVAIATALLAVVAPTTAAAATADPCTKDRRLVTTWNRTFDAHTRLTDRQLAILQQIFSLLGSGQTLPRGLVTELQSLVTRDRRVLASGERQLVAAPAGTANGRAFKRLALRFVRTVARPMNECIAKLLTAESPSETAAVAECADGANRRSIPLNRALLAALKRMTTDKACPERARP